jgi:hypothetical protein
MGEGLLVKDFLGKRSQISSWYCTIEDVAKRLGDCFEGHDDSTEGLLYVMPDLYVRTCKSLTCSFFDFDLG